MALNYSYVIKRELRLLCHEEGKEDQLGELHSLVQCQNSVSAHALGQARHGLLHQPLHFLQ